MKAKTLMIAPIVIVTSPVLAAPPIIQTVATPPPPAPIIMAPPPGYRRDMPAPVTLGVSIQFARKTVWSGNLRVGTGNGASYSQSRNEAAAVCPGVDPGRGNYGSNGETLNLRIDRRDSREKGDTFSVMASWARPLPDCQGEGSSSVGLNRVVTLAPGASVELTGDGGLVVQLSRKD